MATETKPGPYALPDSYHEMVKRFPLARIRDAAHLEAAHGVIDGLLVQDLEVGGRAYLDALTDHVGVYEDRHVAIPPASEADVLRELMSANRLGQAQLAGEVAIAQSTISAVLAGTRSLTRAQVIRMAARFGLPATVFLGR